MGINMRGQENKIPILTDNIHTKQQQKRIVIILVKK